MPFKKSNQFGKLNKGKHWKMSEEGKKKAAKARIGHLVSEKTKEKISKANRISLKRYYQNGGKAWIQGKHIQTNTGKTHFKKGRVPWNKGKPFLQIRGENHPLWKGGISSSNERVRKSIESRFWKEGNMARDNYTCQKCGIRGGKLCVHHIQNFAQYPELRFSIDNGITFCKKCHGAFHKKYGIKNNTKEQIKEFLKKT